MVDAGCCADPGDVPLLTGSAVHPYPDFTSTASTTTSELAMELPMLNYVACLGKDSLGFLLAEPHARIRHGGTQMAAELLLLWWGQLRRLCAWKFVTVMDCETPKCRAARGNSEPRTGTVLTGNITIDGGFKIQRRSRTGLTQLQKRSEEKETSEKIQSRRHKTGCL